MPYYDQAKADRMFRRLVRNGVPEEDARLRVKRTVGMDAGVDAAATPTPPEVPSDEEERSLIEVERAIANKRLARLKSGTFTKNTSNDLMDAGIKFHTAASDVTRQIDPKDKIVREMNRLSNFVELAAGGTAWALTRPQQILFGLMSGEGSRSFDRGVVDTEGTMRQDMAAMDDLEQQGAIDQSGGKLVHEFLNDPGVFDQEPYIMEAMKDDLTGQEVLETLRNQEATDAFLLKHPRLGIALGTASGTIMDLFADPLLIAEFAPKGFAAAGRLYGKLTGKPAIWQGRNSILADTLARRKKAGAEVARLSKELEGDKQNIEVLRQLDAAQRKYIDLDAALKQMVPGDRDLRTPEAVLAGLEEAKRTLNADVGDIRGPIHRNPATVFNAAESPAGPEVSTRGSVAKVRQRAVALGHASDEEVKGALGARGWNTIEQFQTDLKEANDAVRDNALILSNVVYDTLNKFESLPPNVKAHLDAMGWSRARIMRQHSLNRPTLTLDGGVWSSDPAALEKRALLGPTDSEEVGEAARRITEGATGEDVYIHGALIPEHEIVRQGEFAEWGDGTWMVDAPDPHKVKLNDGTWVTPDKVQRQLRFRRSFGGMTPGSLHLRTPEILDNTAGAWIRGSRNWLNGWRRPSSALAHTQGYAIYRSGHGNYITHTIANESWYETQLKKFGWGKMNKAGRLTYSNAEGEQHVKNVFHLLDAENDIELADGLARATDEEKDFYFVMRKWFDNAAQHLGLNKGEYLRHYAPHVFPLRELASGARPLEFVGLPVTATVNFDHLRFRIGAGGYTDDLNQVFQVYNRGLWRKVDMEPTFQRMLDLRDTLRRNGDPSGAEYLDDLVRDARGLPSPVDQVIGRDLRAAFSEIDFETMQPHTQAALRISGLFHAGLLAGNPTYFAQNLTTAAVSTAALHGGMATAAGMLAMGAPGPAGKAWRKMAQQSGTYGLLRQAMENMHNSPLGRAIEAIGRRSGIEHSENLNRGFAWHASFSDQLRRSGMTMDEAIESGVANRMNAQAIADAEFTQHVYGTMGRSPKFHKYLGRGATTLTTMFMSFPFNHGEMLLAMGKDNPGYVLRYFAYSGYLARLASEAGINVTGSLGVAPLAPQIGDERLPFPTSPPVDMLLDTARVGYSSWQHAMGKSDPAVLEKALADWQKDVDGLVPLLGPAKRYEKNLFDWMSGGRRDKEGGLDRRMERTVVTPTGELNPDLLPTFLNLRGMEDARFRSEVEQRQEQMRTNLWQMNKYMKRILRAYDAGNMDEVRNLSIEAWEKHGILRSQRGIVEAEKAAMLERRTRDMLANPAIFPKELVEKVVAREREYQERRGQ